MPIVPIREIEVREGSDQSWEDAAARAVHTVGRELVKNLDSLHLESPAGNGPDHGHYEVEVKIALRWKRLEPRVRIAG